MKHFSEPKAQIIRQELHRWFERNRRSFPWRQRRTPYRVWVAEIMLQQTRTDQAQPYYERFMRAFPSLKKLAQASRQEVLKQWVGLGYYGRAGKLHQTARLIQEEYGGRFPRNYEEMLKLPGIGPYTAAAIGSLAMNMPRAVVDGNVIRVLSRLMAVEERMDSSAGKKLFQRLADQLLDVERPGMHNESMMELGAVCCLPRRPTCASCPLAPCCEAFRTHSVYDYPKRKPRAKVPHIQVGAGVLVDDQDRILVARRREGDMLGGLWEFPGGKCEAGETLPECIRRELMEELGVDTQIEEYLLTVHHAYSHFTMELHAYRGRIRSGKPRPLECAEVAWSSRENLPTFPMSKADDCIRHHVLAAPKQG